MKTLRLPAWLPALALCLPLLTLPACSARGQEEYRDFHTFAMDTYITYRLSCVDDAGKPLDDAYLEEVAGHCSDLLAATEHVLSAHNPSSEVYALNTDINYMLAADEQLLGLLDTATVISDLTGGAYDYTLGALTELWNVTGGGPVPPPEAIDEALTHTGAEHFRMDGTSITKLDPAAKLDFGGAAKGTATQQLLEYLDTTDVAYGLVSLGGNIGVFGEKPEYGTYKIGVRDPDDPAGVLGYFYLQNGFVSVSGDYERYFEENGVRYHHILDPKTGYPAQSGLRSVAVHTANGTSADALSTALFILGVDASMTLYEEGSLDFEAVFVTDDHRVLCTPGLTDSFELTHPAYTPGPGVQNSLS